MATDVTSFHDNAIAFELFEDLCELNNSFDFIDKSVDTIKVLKNRAILRPKIRFEIIELSNCERQETNIKAIRN